MSVGPIEFMGEGAPHEVPRTEFGGDDGLIQPSPAEVGLVAADGMEIGHELDPHERGGVLMRSASEPNEVTARNEAEKSAEVLVTDPATGRAYDASTLSDEVTGKPGREHGLGEGTWQ
jgi:hypothetical protein